MARDFPDDYGYQVFPSYGESLYDKYLEVLVDDGVYAMHSIQGKGRTAGGLISPLSSNTDHNEDIIRVQIDGELVFNYAIETILYKGMLLPYSAPVFVRLYDIPDKRFALGVSPDVTFDSELVIEYEVTVGTQVTVLSELFYYLYRETV